MWLDSPVHLTDECGILAQEGQKQGALNIISKYPATGIHRAIIHRLYIYERAIFADYYYSPGFYPGPQAILHLLAPTRLLQSHYIRQDLSSLSTANNNMYVTCPHLTSLLVIDLVSVATRFEAIFLGLHISIVFKHVGHKRIRPTRWICTHILEQQSPCCRC